MCSTDQLGSQITPWSTSDDALLREGVELLGPKRWRDIAAMMFPKAPRRSASECRAHWWSLTRSKEVVDKRTWSAEEDELLTELVEEYANHNWSIIASQIPGRNAKQCRERWHNQIRPDLNHSTWSEQEDAVIIAKQREIGNKWAMIARHLPGRTDNMVKNRWHATLARRGRPSTPTSSSPSLPPSSSTGFLLPDPQVETLLHDTRGRKRACDGDHGQGETERWQKRRRNSVALDSMVDCVAQILLTWQKRDSAR